MANTTSQAEAIRDLLVERLELFDPALDVSEGSALWTQVVEPVFETLGTDPFDTDIRSFLKDRVTQAFPSLAVQDGDSLVDLLITPLEVLLEPLKREMQIVRRAQSARHPELMRLEDARDLAANFFVTWRSGQRASGVERVFFAAPTYLTVLPTVEFSTASGLKFYPTAPVVVRPEQMSLFRSGSEYYVDVPVAAAETGQAYNVEKGTIKSVRGITGFTRITNIANFVDGLDAETVDELLARVRASLTERSLVVRRGIAARLLAEFPVLRDVEVVGFGDPEMRRDILTARGEGSVVASGVCFVVGQFVLMFSLFEDRGPSGSTAVSVGDEVELNFWRFLYDTDGGSANEKFTVDTILFDSREAVSDVPSVLLFRISSAPSVTAPVVGTLPGVLPGVFAVVRGPGKIEVSDIPGGILNPTTARGTVEINDGEVHVGGHYDVWVRSAVPEAGSTSLPSVRSSTAVAEGTDLVTNGESSSYRHVVHRRYAVTSAAVFAVGASLVVAASGAQGVVARVTVSGGVRVYELWEMNGVEFAVGDSVTDGTTTGTLTSVDSQGWDSVATGMTLSVPKGNEAGSYRILRVSGPFLYVDVELTTTARQQHFRVIDEVSTDLFTPKSVFVPFGDADGTDLRTTIGSTLLRTTVNLQDYGAGVGDTVEVLSGDDRGTYVIQSWSDAYGGTGPVVDRAMTATNSGVSYSVYRSADALPRPLLRVVPDGVALLDAAGRDSGYRVPYALPVDARARGSFSGARTVASGLNGFVLMDPGSGWAPDADYATNIETFDWTTYTGGAFEDFYTAEKFKRCYTDECLDSEGYVAVISVYGSDGQMFLDSNLPSNAQNFLSNMRTWLLSVIATFNFGGDEEELVNAFSPLRFGPNTDTATPLLLQFEVLIPFAVFDGCNNVFVALPEFDWENEFAAEASFGDAVGRFNDGAMTARDPRLLSAQAGDVLTVLAGQNAGAYVIDSVQRYYLINAGALVDGGSAVNLDNAYKVALVVIRDEFPVPPLNGLAEFFEGGTATWSLPSVPALPFSVTDVDGAPVSGWSWVETALTWFFQLLTSMGFDLPSNVSLDVPSTLKAFWELLFNAYLVGRPTAPQTVRVYFQEPTSCVVHAPQACARYQWAAPVHAAFSVEGAVFTLPLPDLAGVEASMTLASLIGSTVLSGTLPAGAGTASTVAELAAVLQELLDPSETSVVFSGPEEATGALTVSVSDGDGVDGFLYLGADALSDAFRWMGFFRTDGGRWAELPSTSAPAYVAQHVTITPDSGFSLRAYTSWARLTLSTTVMVVDTVVGTFADGDVITDLTAPGASASVKVDGTTFYLYDLGGAGAVFSPGDSVTNGLATANVVSVSVGSLTDGETLTGESSACVGTATEFLLGLDVDATESFAESDVITGPSGSGRVRLTATPHRLLVYDVTGTFAQGDSVSGAPSGSTAIVEEVQTIVVVKNASTAFTGGELVTGGSSGTTGYLLALEDPYVFEANVSLAAGVDLTHDEVAVDMGAKIQEVLVTYLVVDAAATVQFEEVSGTWGYTVTLSGTGLVEFALLAPVAFDPVADLTTALFGGTVLNNGTLVDRGGEPDGFFIATFALQITTSEGVSTLSTQLSYGASVALDDAVDTAAGSSSYDDLAAALNAIPSLCEISSSRALWYVGGDALTVRTVAGKSTTTVIVTTGDPTTDAFELLAFGDTDATGTDAASNAIGHGATAAGSLQTTYWHPPAPTILVTAAGASELLFAPSLEASPHQVYPGAVAGAPVPLTELPRDIVAGTPYVGQQSAEFAFTDSSVPSPLSLGVTAGDDRLLVHAQRILLEHTDYSATDTDASPDRVVAVLTSFGSPAVSLPEVTSSEFTFLAPNSGADDDQVQVGDVLFVEEGDDAGGYVVVDRSATTLTLDRALTATTERIYRAGNDGVIGDGTTFASASASFTSDDVGRYLTLWACNRALEDGSYRITAVETDGSACTLDTDAFAESETDVHWAVVRAPTSSPESSGTGGRTALVGLRPVRVYRGDPCVFRIAEVSPDLSRTSARVTTTLDEDGAPPRKSTRAPYRVVRPGVQRVASSTMATQRERGLYYFDVLSSSLGGDEVYNVPEDTKFEPVFGTYESDGYRIDVADDRYSFSAKEEALLVLTSSFLPRTLDDSPVNLVLVDGRGLLVGHESAPVVAQVQTLLSSEEDRTVCANALARHFLPAYVYLDLSYSGGNASSTIAKALSSHINGLSSVDALDVSKLERVLAQNGVTRYDHPVRVVTLTHDLDRRVVGTVSDNRIDDDEISYNGTNRTTFFVAGPDRSSAADEADVPPGERTRLTRVVPRSTFR